ncbi:hypothetical protein BPO_1062 [Bergeyella porcorum]|uniref:ABC transporter permease n=1 Tax=Bergeyella porcorum TaxID=1735111 RepID=A0AAU0EZA1_9FLAO
MEENNSINLEKENNNMDNNTNSPQNGEQKRKEFEKEFINKGFDFAQRTSANPEMIGKGLDDIYQFFLHGQKMDKDGIRKRIEALKYKNEELEKDNTNKLSEIDKINIENNKHTEDIERNENEIENQKSESLNLENEIAEIKKRDPKKGDETMLNIFLIGTLIIGLGTFVMYMATFGSAQLGLEEGDTFIRGDIFSDLLDDTGKLIVSAIAPIIAIGLGFAYGFMWRKNKKFAAFSFLAVVLFVDAIIGYQLSEAIYNRKYQEGLVEEPWQFSMIFTDFHFYIVLGVNFALYYGFSWFANQYFEEKEKLNPDFIVQQDILKVQNKIDAIKEKIEKIKQHIEELRKFINDNEQKIETLKGNINENEITIKKNREDIIGLENGTIPINRGYLQQLISKYLEGYSSFVNGKYQTDKNTAEIIINKVKDNEEVWFKTKEQTWS